MKYEELVEFDTQLTADVVEWQPLFEQTDASNRVLACGTYQLNKEERTRSGRLYLLQYNLENPSLNQIASHDFTTSGILDMKWIDHQHIVTIDSENLVKVLAFDHQSDKLECAHELNLNEDPNQPSVGLTIDYSAHSNDQEHNLMVSDDKGYVSLIRISSERDCQLQSRFKAHDFETWSVLIDRYDRYVAYSGADDCLMKLWDLRSKQSVGKCTIFEGGVCSIVQPQRTTVDTNGNSSQKIIDGYNEHELLASSYDERIYRLDKRNLKRSVAQSPKLNGGVWKMKIHPFKDLLLCACMHTGAHVVEMGSLESCLYYQGHELNSLAYGCDWMCKVPVADGSSSLFDTVATCSFYNHNLRIWNCFT